MAYTINVGKKLKTIRHEKELTLRELSQQSSVSHTQISDIERGLTSPTIKTLLKLMSALRQDVSFFFVDKKSR